MNTARSRQVSELYQATLARPMIERATFLTEACRDDDALRREVQSLLDQAASARGFLDGDAVETAASIVGPPLLTEQRFGPYRVLELIGVGGMGEVYRARDGKLGRDVAIKLLPQPFAADPDRLARFEREARLLAAVHHPNIGAIYDFAEHDGIRALILELVDGQTLAQVLASTRLSTRDIVALARQIVDALDAAHERGIVHRDLKPSNIKVTTEGVVKLLDFGLATSRPTAPDIASQRITATAAGTREGVILGTAAYMSPEQARGLTVDKRTDIWAFGCVLFEMISGTPAFAGDTATDTIAAILGQEPQWTALPAATPASVSRLMRRCLEKDSRRRLRDIGDARAELEEATHRPDPPPKHAQPGVREVVFQRITDFRGTKEAPALSPDGKMAAFVALIGGRRQIWIRFLAGGAALQVTRDDVDHEHPRWVPDSTALIYYTPPAARGEGAIWETGALGGAPRRMTSATCGGDISHDGQRIAVFQRAEGGVALMAVARDGSRVRRIALLPAGFTYSLPRWSPDDAFVAFQRASNTAWDMCLERVAVANGGRQLIVRNDWLQGYAWRSDGTGLVYSSSKGSTSRYPPTFNLRTIEQDGHDDRQLTFGDHSFVDPDGDRSGRVLCSRITSQSDIWKIPIAGGPAENVRGAERVTNQTAQVQTPSANPEQTEVVYLSDGGGHANLWITRMDGSAARQLTFEQDPDISIGAPRWAPDGSLIVFIASRGGQTDLWTIHPDGSDYERLVEKAWGPCWSGDSQWIYFHSLVKGAERVEKISRDGRRQLVVRNELGSRQPAVALDGSALYFDMPVGLQALGYWGADHEIWRAHPENGAAERLHCIPAARVPISPGMFQPVLSPDGRSLAMPLMDGATTNIWCLPTDGRALYPITEFRHRPVIIARSVDWSADGRSIYAAVAETGTDIVLFDGLM
jgi:serine/threonine protein kinase/Tol biopolymer transport system component